MSRKTLGNYGKTIQLCYIVGHVETTSKELAMIPIQNLLSRIRWDREFGKSSFEIGYLDHVEKKVIRTPFGNIRIEEENHFSFHLESPSGDPLLIPLHRIREVYQDGFLIWRRPSP